MESKPLPSQEWLNELFVYSIVTGQLWRRSTGTVVGWPEKTNGPLRVGVAGRNLLVHRVIWKMVTGEDVDLIDHSDGCRVANQWLNLRPADKSKNMANSKLSSKNTSGFKNVFWSKQKSKWMVQITVQGQQIHCGFFPSLAAAAAAAEKAREEHFGEFARAA
jgi:hypothetical protein